MGGNAALLAKVYDAWGRGDVDALVALYDPQIEFVTSGAFPGLSSEYRGHDGAHRFWHDFGQMWESLEIVAERFEEKDDVVVGLWHFSGTGRNGVPVVREGGHIAVVRDGLITYIQAYASWDEALAAYEAR